ncbi:hypothetical protein C5167_039803 [Papaver somniferum]|uniref:Uncharacterized protein n=1 Tax=Papaver somniferum TaxID=3469 RepID=A0A4Y7IHC5_PAPSO|nr:hypothetical protein C5167_039803 [Papaver somniferum]
MRCACISYNQALSPVSAPELPLICTCIAQRKEQTIRLAHICSTDKMIPLQQKSIIEGEQRDETDIFNEVLGIRFKRRIPEDASRLRIIPTRDIDSNHEPN